MVSLASQNFHTIPYRISISTALLPFNLASLWHWGGGMPAAGWRGLSIVLQSMTDEEVFAHWAEMGGGLLDV